MPTIKNTKRGAALWAAFLIIFLFVSFIPKESQGLGWTAEELLQQMKKDRAKKKKREKTLKRIEKLEKKGEQKGAKELLEILNDQSLEYSIRAKALRALGRLKRPEDIPALIKWAKPNKIMGYIDDDLSSGKSMAELCHRYAPFYVAAMDSLGEIGGPEICQHLNEFLQVEVKKPGFEMGIDPLVQAIRKAGCLSEEELLKIVWGHARNMWATQFLQRSALGILKEAGDKEAEAMLNHYEAILKNSFKRKSPGTTETILNISLGEAKSILLDVEMPWWIKTKIMYKFRLMSGSKEELLDTCFVVAANFYEEMPELPMGDLKISRCSSIIWRENSQWTRTNALDYLEAKRDYYRKTMDKKAFRYMDKFITYLLNSYREYEASQTNIKAWEERQKLQKQAQKEETKEKAPEKQSTLYYLRSEPKNAELFIFDEKSNWFGLVHMDLYLASILGEIEKETDKKKKESFQSQAIMALVAEEQLPKEYGWRGYPLLMPLPIGFLEKEDAVEWQPKMGNFRVIFGEEQRHLFLLQALDETSVVFRINSDPKNIDYSFNQENIPKNSWVVAEVRTDRKEPLVFISNTGESLDQRFMLLLDETMKEESIKGDEEEARILNWFLSARKTLEEYEKEVMAKAGGSSGIQHFRKELLKVIEELKDIKRIEESN